MITIKISIYKCTLSKKSIVLLFSTLIFAANAYSCPLDPSETISGVEPVVTPAATPLYTAEESCASASGHRMMMWQRDIVDTTLSYVLIPESVYLKVDIPNS